MRGRAMRRLRFLNISVLAPVAMFGVIALAGMLIPAKMIDDPAAEGAPPKVSSGSTGESQA